jgi:hypothetical protein
MTQNAMDFPLAIVYLVGGVAVLFIFALTVAIGHRPKTLPGSSGHREKEAEGEHEVIRPDGYIDSFANVIEEAGGSLPPVVRIALPGVILWWLIYLIVYWTPR